MGGCHRGHANCKIVLSLPCINSFTTIKQPVKFSSVNFQTKIKSKLYHIENSKTIGQTV